MDEFYPKYKNMIDKAVENMRNDDTFQKLVKYNLLENNILNFEMYEIEEQLDDIYPDEKLLRRKDEILELLRQNEEQKKELQKQLKES